MQTLVLMSAVIFAIGAASGCGGRPLGATAKGTVTIDGKPAPAGIRVDFLPVAAGGSMSSGVTDDAGQYELWFNANMRGVMPGECVVRLSLSETTGADGLPAIPETLRHVRIPEHFGERSQTIRTIHPGVNKVDVDVTTSSPGRGSR